MNADFFDDQGQRVPVAWPDAGASEANQSEASASDIRAAQRETLCRLLSWLCADGDPQTAGRKALLVGYLMRLPPLAGMTHAEVAERLGVHRSRVTQLLTTLRDEAAWDAMG